MSETTKHQLVSGYAINVQRERVSSVSSLFYSGNEPANVSLHKLGQDERSYMTPDEARALGVALLAAASCADGKATAP